MMNSGLGVSICVGSMLVLVGKVGLIHGLTFLFLFIFIFISFFSPLILSR